MKAFLLIALFAGTVVAIATGVVFVALVRWLNLVIASLSGPWFPTALVSSKRFFREELKDGCRAKRR